MTRLVNVMEVPLEEVPLDDLMESGANRPIVLVVDDEPLVADTLAMILTRAGYDTVRAYNGRAALEIARARRPDLLISDVAMPGMNGVELALGLVAMDPGCKVVLFSGHATSLDLISAYAAGHEFPLLAKPVHPTQVLVQVAKSLELVAA